MRDDERRARGLADGGERPEQRGPLRPHVADVLPARADRHVDPVGSGGLGHERHDRRQLVDVEVGLDGQADPDRDLRPERTDGRDDVRRQAAATGTIAAVAVGARVGFRREELRQEIAVSRVQLDAVEAGFGDVLRRARKGLDDVFDLLDLELPRLHWLAR
jgi:hypothetical protein